MARQDFLGLKGQTLICHRHGRVIPIARRWWCLDSRLRFWSAVFSYALGLFVPASSAFCLTQGEITAAALSTYNNKASSFPSNYDLNYYLNGVPPYPRYEAALLTWQETYLGIANLAMYQATQSNQYLESLLNNAEVMYANRGDRVFPPMLDQIRNTYMPSFVSFNLSEGDDARQHSWLVESAYQTHPVTYAIAHINSNPQLQAEFGARAAALTADIIQTMDSFDPEFSMISGGRGQYNDPYLAFTDPFTNGVLPYNMQSAGGQIYIALWKATEQQRFYDRAVALAKTLKAELTPVGDRFSWRYAPYNSSGSASDVSHAGLDVAFAVDAYEAGIVFDDTDIQRLVNTFRYIKKAPGFTATVNGSGAGVAANTRLVSTWLQLTRYDASLRQEMFPVFQSYWNTDCCGWPMMGAGLFYESGQVYTPQTAFDESFDGLQLGSRWRRPATQSISDGWVAQTTGSQLVVSDIKSTTNGSWVDIVKTRDVDQDNSWEVAFDFAWDSANGTTDPLQAMQRFYVELRNEIGTLIASIGINDGWYQENGGRVIQLFDQSILEPYNSIGANGSASIRILGDEMRGVSQVYWNDALVLSTPLIADLKQVGMRFGYYRHFNGAQLLSHFGTISVDSLVVSEALLLAGDYNKDGVVDAADYIDWRNGLGTLYTQADYEVWRAHFGQAVVNGSALPIAIPEPTATVLLIMAAIMPLRLRGPRGKYELLKSQATGQSDLANGLAS